MIKRQGSNYLLILLIILENLFLLVFYRQHITSQAVNSTCYFTTSLLFGLITLVKFYNIPEISVYPQATPNKKYLLILFYAACFLLLNSVTIRIIKTNDYAQMSDIIPAIQIFSKRLLSGQIPYSQSAMEPLGYHGPSNYLPLHWLPYSIAEFFHFDYRTITFAIWFLGALVVMFRSMRCKNICIQILIPVLVSGSYLLLVNVSPGTIACTVETMIAGYYMLLYSARDKKVIC